MMTPDQFEEYLEAVNRAAAPFVPLVNCAACGKPIETECVIRTRFDPPRWLHGACDRKLKDF